MVFIVSFLRGSRLASSPAHEPAYPLVPGTQSVLGSQEVHFGHIGRAQYNGARLGQQQEVVTTRRNGIGARRQMAESVMAPRHSARRIIAEDGGEHCPTLAQRDPNAGEAGRTF